jgi:hypothetical protein
MMDDYFASVLRDKIRKDMNDYTDDMANGVCADFAGYQKLCGVIQGLALAERHLLDLVEAQQKAEDEDEGNTFTAGDSDAGANSTSRKPKRGNPY